MPTDSPSAADPSPPHSAVYRVEVEVRPDLLDSRGLAARAELRAAGLEGVEDVRSVRGYSLALPGGRAAADRIAAAILADPVSERASVFDGDAAPVAPAGAHRVDVVKRPGVMDPSASGVRRAIENAGEEVEAVKTYTAYRVRGPVDADALRLAAARCLGNEVIESITVGTPAPVSPFTDATPAPFRRVEVPLPQDDAGLLEVSRDGGLSLSLVEMRAIREHFRALGRDPTDVELETLAQTWSEHCRHKTLAGIVDAGDRRYENLLKETIFAATRRLDLPWCISVFEDNAGVVAFDDDYHVTFKVETHNHPSAIEPYGGAGTGIGGVLRDTMGTGLGARPVVSTDVFCFGPPDMRREEVPRGALHPLRTLKGVVSGVRDYGNRMGIPTANGAVLFDPRFTGNPLVFCGSVGLLPRDKVEKRARPGDCIVVAGGRTGRDGIHGATFSSRELHSESESVDSGAVQIGNAITEKALLDAMLQARDRGLYACVTDCGAGGLSSAVGEMAEACGAEVDLERVPLKYGGLTYDEIWISEAQERMVFAVPPQHLQELLDLFRSEDVEATPIGSFTDSGRLVLRFEGKVVGDLDLAFLFGGLPRVARKARLRDKRGAEPELPPPRDLATILERLLARPDVASKEWIVRQYDHEVQAGNVIKPFVGPGQRTPADAAVIRPRLDSFKGIAVGNGIKPRYGDIDPYAMGLLAIDEAVRNVIAVGARADRIALLDNFCAGNCEREEILGEVMRVAEACRDAALALRCPFISGKDSLNNEFRTDRGTVAIPTTLLASSLGIVEDVRRAVSSDFKRPGDAVVVIGLTRAELGGSEYYAELGHLGRSVPQVDLEAAAKTFRAVSDLTSRGLLAACHDVSDGGIGAALAEMCFSRGVGVAIDLGAIPAAPGPEQAPTIDRDDVRLFSESPSRFVAEVRPSDVERVREVLGELPHAVVGEIDDSGRIRARGVSGSTVLDASVRRLREAFENPLDLDSIPPGPGGSP